MVNSQASVTTVSYQVDELRDVMRNNIRKALDRGANLEDLNERTEDLNEQANQFKKTSGKTKSKFVWKNRKWTIILISVIFFLVVLIILGIVLGITLSTKKT